MEHSSENSELVLDLAAFHLHKISSHGSSRQVCNGLEGCCRLKVIASIKVPGFLHLLRTFMGKSLISNTFMLSTFHNSHFITGMTSSFLVVHPIHNCIKLCFLTFFSAQSHLLLSACYYSLKLQMELYSFL